MPSKNVKDTSVPDIHDLFHQMDKGTLESFSKWFLSLPKPLQETVRTMRDGRSTGLLEQAVVLGKHDWLSWCLKNDWPIVNTSSGGVLFECNISTRFNGGKKPVLFRDLIGETTLEQWKLLCNDFNTLQYFQKFACITPLSNFLDVLNNYEEHKKTFQDVCGESLAHLFVSNGSFVNLEILSNNGFDNNNIIKSLHHKGFNNICAAFLNFLNVNATKTKDVQLLKTSYQSPVFNHIMLCDEMKRVLTTMWTDESPDNPLFKWTELNAIPLNLAIDILDKMLSVVPMPTKSSDFKNIQNLLKWGEDNCSVGETNQLEKIQVLKDLITHQSLTNSLNNLATDKPTQKIRGRKI